MKLLKNKISNRIKFLQKKPIKITLEQGRHEKESLINMENNAKQSINEEIRFLNHLNRLI